MGTQAQLSGPDLKDGVDDAELKDQPLLGHADGEAVVLVRTDGQVRAVAASCTHYGGPLAEGIVVDGEIHCPWHHACFDLATGRPRGPAISPLTCWDVQVVGGKIRVGAKREASVPPLTTPERVVIIGAGPAGVACAETLRMEGHRGSITLVTAEGSDPVDRPNLSKDILAGTAPAEWAFLRTAEALRGNDVVVLDEAATEIDPHTNLVRTEKHELPYDALLIATGAEPMRLPIDGAGLPHVHLLRTLADCQAIANGAASGTQAVVIGASFIGLEAAASLRARGAEVTVVAPDATPLARILGEEVGAFVRRVHESHGVTFCLGRKPTTIQASQVVLDDDTKLPASLVVMGVGVKPRLELAEKAGLRVDRGVLVDDQLRAAPGVWAAGDIARYPWAGELVRIEHFQVAVRHGQKAARAMLGKKTRPDVPFFWSQHYDLTISYVGHAERFATPEVHGSLDDRNAHVIYRDGQTIRAVATIGQDRLALEVEAAMERGANEVLEALLR